MPIFVLFESQCPKITVLSKALRAKLSSIPSGVTSLSTPGLERQRENRRHRHGPSFDHSPWRRSHVRKGARWRLLSRMMTMGVCVCLTMCVAWFTWGFECYLSQWRKVGLPLVLWQKSRLNFRRLQKVNGVSTNHWVFLRCDWSPVSS